MRALTIVPALIVLVALSGCVPKPAPAPAPSDPPGPTPTATMEAPAPVLDEDVLLLVTATATADNGAVLDLSMQVHRSVAWDEATADAALMTSTCEGSLEDSVYEANLWSFTSVNVDATASGGTWPTDQKIRLMPMPDDYSSLASDGIVAESDEADKAAPHCLRDRYLPGAGEGRIVLGLAGDTDDVGAAGQFTRWANHEYGFTATGVVLSDCLFFVTDAGADLHGGADWWTDLIDDGTCVTGGHE